MKRYIACTIAVVGLLGLAACSTADPNSTPSSGGDGVKTGPGVTADTIKLGVLQDLSGPYSAGGIAQTDAIRAYYEQLNEDGGICGRSVEVDVRDTAYDVQKSVTQYAQLKDEVLGFPSVLGGPANAALKPNYARDDMTVIAITFTQTLLDSPNIMLSGPTSEYWVANGIDWLLEEGDIAEGDKVGVIYFAGESGVPVLNGAQYASEAAGLDMITAEIAPTATDMSGPVTSFKREGVRAILVQGTPGITAGVAGAAASAGLEVPLVTVTGGGFNPDLLNTPAADYLKEHLLILLPWKMSDEDPAVASLLEKIETENPDSPINENTLQGIGLAAGYADLLNRACDAGDLTREGIQTALREVEALDSDGVLVPLDFTEVGRTPSTSIFVNVVDPDGLGGERTLTDEPFSGELAADFQP